MQVLVKTHAVENARPRQPKAVSVYPDFRPLCRTHALISVGRLSFAALIAPRT